MENPEKEFVRLFKTLTQDRRKDKAFYDFVKTSAIALHNATAFDQTLEDEYLAIVGEYEANPLQNMCEMLSCLIAMLDSEPRDILGKLYMDLEIQEKDKGQFFYPT